MDVRIEAHRDASLAERLERTAFRRGRLELAHRFHLDPDSHYAAWRGSAPIAVTSCVVYPGADLAWIGGMVVVPEERGRGIARALLRRALEHAAARGAHVVGLDATDEGRRLYEAHGFSPVGGSTRWEATRVTAPATSRFAVYPASGAELMEIAAFDRPRFGANRAPWIAAIMRDFPQRAFVAYRRDTGGIAGFVLGQDGHLGPLVADDADAVAGLVHATVSAGTPPIAHVLDANPSARSAFEAAGFKPTDARCLRMVRGGRLPGVASAQVALGAWALG